MRLIECWESFEARDLQYFHFTHREEVLRKTWQIYLSDITTDVYKLRMLQRPLQQKIETFDNMRSGVCGPCCGGKASRMT